MPTRKSVKFIIISPASCQPYMNRAIELANKNVERIIEKMAKNYKDWPDKLLFALWGY